MASIRREVVIRARPEQVWDALRDVGALHTRLVRGFVTDVKLEEGALLPHELAPRIGTMIEEGLRAAQRTLESA